jgi:hypothetical protein
VTAIDIACETVFINADATSSIRQAAEQTYIHNLLSKVDEQ